MVYDIITLKEAIFVNLRKLFSLDGKPHPESELQII